MTTRLHICERRTTTYTSIRTGLLAPVPPGRKIRVEYSAPQLQELTYLQTLSLVHASCI